MGTEADGTEGGMRGTLRCPLWELKRALGLREGEGTASSEGGSGMVWSEGLSLGPWFLRG